MKKILTPMTGIVLLVAILIAGGCAPADSSDKVTIYLKAYEDGEEMKLKLYDSTNKTPVDAEDHFVYVEEGTKVVWRRADKSGIISIKRVGPKADKGLIFPGDATTILLGKRRRITVPTDVQLPDLKEDYFEEPYDIKIKFKKNKKEKNIDPYLRIKS